MLVKVGAGEELRKSMSGLFFSSLYVVGEAEADNWHWELNIHRDSLRFLNSPPTASISSKKIIQAFLDLAISKSSLTILAPCRKMYKQQFSEFGLLTI